MATLPGTGPLQELAPRCARRDGVRCRGVSVDGRALLFHAEGPGLAAGVYRQDRDEEAPPALLRADDGWRGLNPRRAGSRILLQLQRASRLSSGVEAIAVLDVDGGELLRLPGQVFATSADGRVAVVMDLPGRALRAVDLDRLAETGVAALDGALDPLLAMEPALAHDGRAVVFMDARHERGDASLEFLDLRSGQRQRLLGPLPVPSWIAASLAPDGSVLALSCQPGDAPHATLWRIVPGGGRSELLRLAVTQPGGAPIAVDDGVVALLASLAPHPTSTGGPVDLVLVSTTGGALQQVTRHGGLQGTLRGDGAAIVVEGGACAWRVELR